MRITGPGSTGTAATRKGDRKGASGEAGAFGKRLEGGTAVSAASAGNAAAPLGPVGAIEALLALQAAPDPSAGRSRGLMRGHDLLDLLEEVRRGILLGVIPRAQLDRLAMLARAGREDFTDPALAAILDEIELRAEVELAKLDRDGQA